jgi:hypothetical protein
MYKKFISILSAWSAVALLMLGLSPVAHGATATIYENPVGGTNRGPFGITVGPDGNIWFANSTGTSIGVMNSTGTVLNTYSTGLTAGGLPTAITYASNDGNFWVTVQNTNKIAKVTPTGTITEYPTGGTNCRPVGIIEASDNQIWFTCFTDETINSLDPATGTVTVEETLNAGSSPNDIIEGPDGKIWFTEFNGDEIGRLTLDGVTLNEFAITPGSAPNFLTEGPDGNIWFTNFDANSVQAMNTSGTTVATFPTGTPASRPFGITASADGYIWYTMYDGNIITRMTTAGVMNKFQAPTGNAKPSLILEGPGNNIFFSELNNNSIGKLVVSTIDAGAGGGTTPSAPNTSSLVNKTNAVPIAAGVLALLATLAVAGFWVKSEFKNKK